MNERMWTDWSADSPSRKGKEAHIALLTKMRLSAEAERREREATQAAVRGRWKSSVGKSKTVNVLRKLGVRERGHSIAASLSDSEASLLAAVRGSKSMASMLLPHAAEEAPAKVPPSPNAWDAATASVPDGPLAFVARTAALLQLMQLQWASRLDSAHALARALQSERALVRLIVPRCERLRVWTVLRGQPGVEGEYLLSCVDASEGLRAG